MRFDDLDYVKQYNQNGKFPKIHDDIYSLDKYVPKGNIMDLGCCTGLLSCRLAEKHKLVVGIEGNAHYLNNAIHKENVNYFNIKICEDTMHELKEIVKKYNIDCVYARRVLPEICDAGGTKLVRGMISMFRECGVKYIVIEGRKCNSKSIHTLKNIDREKEMFEGFYKLKESYKNCAIFAI